MTLKRKITIAVSIVIAVIILTPIVLLGIFFIQLSNYEPLEAGVYEANGKRYQLVDDMYVPYNVYVRFEIKEISKSEFKAANGVNVVQDKSLHHKHKYYQFDFQFSEYGQTYHIDFNNVTYHGDPSSYENDENVYLEFTEQFVQLMVSLTDESYVEFYFDR